MLNPDRKRLLPAFNLLTIWSLRCRASNKTSPPPRQVFEAGCSNKLTTLFSALQWEHTVNAKDAVNPSPSIGSKLFHGPSVALLAKKCGRGTKGPSNLIRFRQSCINRSSAYMPGRMFYCPARVRVNLSPPGNYCLTPRANCCFNLIPTLLKYALLQ